jgi:micrococcal nuclease
MLQKINSIENIWLRIIAYFFVFTIGFYFLFFVLGYYLIRQIWKLKIDTKWKYGIAVVPLLFFGIIGSAWSVGLSQPTKPSYGTLDAKKSSSSSVISSVPQFVQSSPTIISSSSSLESSSAQSSSQSSQVYIKLEQGKSIDNEGQTVEFVNDIKEVEVAINTVPAQEFVKVLDVIDGDTVKVEKFGTLRLIGIDTPETKDPRKVIQCFGKEATQNAKNKLSGQKVRLEFNPADRIDKYNRVLAYIITESGYDYNYNAILDGYANAYIKFPHPRSEQYLDAQRQARESKNGLWSDSTCNGDTNQPSAENTKTNVQIPPVIPAPIPAPKFVEPVIEQPKAIDPTPSAESGLIRKSNNKRCHSPLSPNYDDMRVTGTYNSFEECEASGAGVTRYK